MERPGNPVSVRIMTILCINTSKLTKRQDEALARLLEHYNIKTSVKRKRKR